MLTAFEGGSEVLSRLDDVCGRHCGFVDAELSRARLFGGSA